MTLYLASSSPRRSELCQQIGIKPTLLSGVVCDEASQSKELPRLYAARMARKKSLAAQRTFSSAKVGDVIVTADTVVAVGRRILHKTDEENVARGYLGMLSGRRHRVYGGLVVAVLREGGWQMRERLSETRIRFARLTTMDIVAYLAASEWQGCAGGYAIQGQAARFVAHLQGSYSNVVGLDLYHLSRLLPSKVWESE